MKCHEGILTFFMRYYNKHFPSWGKQMGEREKEKNHLFVPMLIFFVHLLIHMHSTNIY